MKKLLALFLAMAMCYIPQPFSAYADTAGLVVDVKMNADGSFSNAVTDEAASFLWSNSSAPKPVCGSFTNKTGGQTDFLQFGKDPDGDGTYEKETDANFNYLKIGSANMINQNATTVSFWVNMEDMWKLYSSFVAFGEDSTSYANTDKLVTNEKAEYAFYDLTADTMYFHALGATRAAVSNASWKGSWCHLVITREYSEEKNSWDAKLYKDGVLTATQTVSGALPEEDGYAYLFGGKGAAKYSGIKLYNNIQNASSLYMAQKDLYEEKAETEMRLISPAENGTFSKTRGELVLKFNCAPADSSISGITLKKTGENENYLKNGVVNQTAKTVTFTYSGLTVGESYVLSLKGVSSADGKLVMEDVTLNYTVLADSALKVDVKLNADGTVSGSGASFSWSNASAPKPAYGSFSNEEGSETSYLQFGKDSNGDGIFERETDANFNYLKISSADMRNQNATTVSFWVNMEDMWGLYSSFIAFGEDKTAYSNTNNIVANGEAEYAFFDLTTNTMYFQALGVTRAAVSNSSWRGNWCHLAIVREYNSASNNWTAKLYKDGTLVATQTVSGELPDETDYVYLLGGKGAAKYSGIKLYNAVCDAAELYETEKGLYVALPESMVFESAEPFDKLSQAGGEIEIKFNNYVDEDSISGICLTDTDGNPINGKQLLYLPAKRSKTVVLRYGQLDGEEYKLVIPEGVRSVNGYETQEASMYYTCVSNVIYYEDFEDVSLEDGGIDGLYAQWDKLAIETDAQTERKFLKLTDDEAAVFYSLSELFDEEEVAYELKFRPESGEILSLYTEENGGGEKCTMLVSDNSGAKYDDGKISFSTSADEEGWHRIKMVTGISEDNNRYFDFYYDATKPMVYHRVINNDFIQLGSIMLAKGKDILIDEIKVYQRAIPNILGSNSSNDKIYFSADMNAKSLQKAKIYYISEDGEKIEASVVSYNEAERSVTLNFNNYFLYGKTYDLFIDGAYSEDGVMLLENSVYSIKAPVYDIQVTNPVFRTTNGNRVAFTVSSSKTDETVVSVIILHKDKDGRIKYAKCENVDVDIPVDILMSNLTAENDDVFEVMIFDDVAGGAKPVLLAPVTFKYREAE